MVALWLPYVYLRSLWMPCGCPVDALMSTLPWPGQQLYLAMVECARPLDVLQPPPGATDVFNDCFWLVIALYPGA